MKLFIKSLSGVIDLDITPNYTILNIKYLIEDKEPLFKVWRQRLIDIGTGERVDHNEFRKVSKFGWGDGTELALVLVDNDYCVPPENIVHRLMENHEQFSDMDWLENQFNLSRGQEYCFSLRHINQEIVNSVRDKTHIDMYLVNLITVFTNGSPLTARLSSDRYVLKGIFNRILVGSERNALGRVYTMGFELVGPLRLYVNDRIENLTQDDIAFIYAINRSDRNLVPYYNIVPCQEEFTGKRIKRSRTSSDAIRKVLSAFRSL